MKHITYLVLLTASVSCALLGAETKKNQPNPGINQAPDTPENLSKTSGANQTGSNFKAYQLHCYAMANLYQSANKIEKAHAWYNRLLQDGMPPYAYPGYIRFLHTLGQNNHIFTLIPKVDSLLPNDPDIQLIFAQVQEQAGKEQESYERIIKLSRNFPLNEEICYAAAQIFIKRQEPAKAIAAIDALINTAPRKQNTFIFHYSKAVAQLLIDSFDSKKQALASIKESLKLQPRFDRGWLLYSLIEEQLGNTQEALRGYATYLNLSGKKLLIELHVQRLKDHKHTPHDTTLKNEQKAILDLVTHKHASADASHYLKEVLTRFAHLNSSVRLQP